MAEPGSGDPDRLPPDPDFGRYGGPNPSRDPDRPPPSGQDPIAVLAVTVGFVGIVYFGILLAILAGILGAWAGQRARTAGRSFELPYLAFMLAALDGVVWIVLHFLFELPIQIG